MVKPLKILFLCLLLCMGINSRAQWDKDVFSFRGRTALQDGRLGEAVANFNILAQLDSTDHWTFFYRGIAKYIIVMAHYDNLGILNGSFYPGADSNASGVAALLEIAAMVNRMNTCHKIYRHSLILVALDGKEKNQAGAVELWRQIDGKKLLDPVSGQPVSASQISLVVNLDQIGGTSAPLTDGNPRFLMMLSDDAVSYRSSLESAKKGKGFGLELGYDYYGSKDFTRLFYRRISDQRIFLEHKIPAVMFTSGITLSNNKPSDNAASLDYDVLKDRIRLIFYWLDKVL